MKHGHHGLKEQVLLPEGVTLALSVTGEVVAIDKDGTRRALDNPDDVRWFFHSVTDTFPAPPRIPHNPKLAAQVRQAQADIEANKPRNHTVTKDADGNVVLTLDDGTVATLPAT